MCYASSHGFLDIAGIKNGDTPHLFQTKKSKTTTENLNPGAIDIKACKSNQKLGVQDSFDMQYTSILGNTGGIARPEQQVLNLRCPS